VLEKVSVITEGEGDDEEARRRGGEEERRRGGMRSQTA